MSFLLIQRSAAATLVVDDALVPAADIPAFTRAVALLAATEEVAGRARAEGHAAGFVEGRRAGEEAAAADLASRLFALEVEAARGRASRRRDAARLALEVVRRIAGEIGPEATVAAIAERAVAELAPDVAVIVKVAPVAQAAAAARLAEIEMVTVAADPELADTDCVLETRLGVVRAGLDTQLAAIERAWEEADG